MPNGHTHKQLGAVVGGAAAFFHARGEAPRAMMIETLGGVCGGVLGGMLPDRLDPPLSPRHRDAFHSLAILLMVAFLVLEAERKACRERAANAAMLGAAGPEPTLQSDAWLFASGFITGLQWGYVSHLVADMSTAASLPLICRGL